MQSRNHEKLWSDSIFRGFFVFSLNETFAFNGERESGL